MNKSVICTRWGPDICGPMLVHKSTSCPRVNSTGNSLNVCSHLPPQGCGFDSSPSELCAGVTAPGCGPQVVAVTRQPTVADKRGPPEAFTLRSGACKSLQCCITATSGPRVQYSVCMHIQNCETSQAPLPLEPRCCGQCPLNMWSNRRLWVQSHLVLVLVVSSCSSCF